MYEEIHDYEAITVKPLSSHEAQQQPLPPPALPAAAPMADQEYKLTPCPAYIPTTFPGNKDTDADREYANVGQSSKGTIEGEYDYIEVSQNWLAETYTILLLQGQSELKDNVNQSAETEVEIPQ